MRRYILGLALLLLLPLLSLPVAKQLEDHHLLIADTLSNASQALHQGDVTRGKLFIQDAYSLWQEKQRFTAAFVHHAPLEAIQCDFAALSAVSDDALAAGCNQLVAQFLALAESQQLNWWAFL